MRRRRAGHETLTSFALALRLVVARCLRRLGRLDEAEYNFKILAGGPQRPTPAAACMSWDTDQQGGTCLPLPALQPLLAALQAGLICACRLVITMLVPPLYGVGVQLPLELVRPASSLPHRVLRG